MAKLRNMLALMAVVLHLAALLVPATAHAAMDHAAGPHGEAHAQADRHALPDDACCETVGSAAPHASEGFCAVCALSCAGLQATLSTMAPAPLLLPLTRHLAQADRTLRSATPEAALRPPRTRS
ncbi:hypothetical protein [Alkalilacustris brevis]|uniref:hypothetical protein n=1 Tax=Alkalilacustris brevis TaxID=2026338 RepID=UPI000E0D357A|nr:hypothetical protein [Alkalilacustris brevis]